LKTIALARSNEEAMRAFSIGQPHAEAIIRGLKTIEYRSRLTTVRGRVYIYATVSRYRLEEEAEMLKTYGMGDVNADDLPRGVLIGTVELWNCTGSGGKYEWHFRDPERATELLKPTTPPQASWFDPF
jgi:hypothetical protein